jgi:hypothetical protein
MLTISAMRQSLHEPMNICLASDDETVPLVERSDGIPLKNSSPTGSFRPSALSRQCFNIHVDGVRRLDPELTGVLIRLLESQPLGINFLLQRSFPPNE